MAKIVKYLSPSEFQEIMERQDAQGKHGSDKVNDWYKIANFNNPTWLLVKDVPIRCLFFEHAPERIDLVQEYANRSTLLPAIYVSLTDFSVTKGETLAAIKNGNHRAAVAIDQGMAYIDAYMTQETWDNMRAFCQDLEGRDPCGQRRFNPINPTRLQGVLAHAILDTDHNEVAAFTRHSINQLTRIEEDDLDELNSSLGQLLRAYGNNQDALDKLQAILDTATEANPLLVNLDPSAGSSAGLTDREWEMEYASSDASHPWADTGYGDVVFRRPKEKYGRGRVVPETLVASRLSEDDVSFYARKGVFEKPLFACHGTGGSVGDFAFTEAQENGKGKPYLAILKFTGGLVMEGLGSVQEFHQEHFGDGLRQWWYEISPEMCRESGADLVLGETEEDFFMAIVADQQCVEVITVMPWQAYDTLMGMAALEAIAYGEISPQKSKERARWMNEVSDEEYGEKLEELDRLNWYQATITDMVDSSSMYAANNMINSVRSSKYGDFSISAIIGRAKSKFRDTDEKMPHHMFQMICQQVITYHPQAVDFYNSRKKAFEIARLVASSQADPLDTELLFLIRYFWYQDSNDPDDIIQHCQDVVRQGLLNPHIFENTGFLESDELEHQQDIDFVVQFLDKHGTRYRNFWIVHPQPYRGGYVCKIDEGSGSSGSGANWHTIPPLPIAIEAVAEAKRMVDIIVARGERRSSVDRLRTDEEWFLAWRYLQSWMKREGLTFLKIDDMRYGWEIDYRRKHPEEFVSPRGLGG